MDGDPGTVYLGDVGWDSWEEQNVAPQGGRNFGWPCHEGAAPQPEYQAADPLHHGCDSLGLGDNTGTLTPPTVRYHHVDPSLGAPPGFAGNAAVGGAFYTAATYPALYQGRYFFADYVRGWIRLAEVDGSDAVLAVSLFAEDADGPVDLIADPVSGDLHYVAILAGEVRRIRWTGPVGSNNPPVAAAAGNPLLGVSPHTVTFSSAGSYDPDLDPLALSWNFGDGVGSGAADPVHTYLAGGTYLAVLTADDGAGGIDRDTVVVTVHGGAGPFPTTPVLDGFDRPDGALGGAWVGETTGAVVESQAATTQCCDVAPLWGVEAFGPDQEGYLTLAEFGQGVQSLLLKVQGMDRSVGYLEVGYDGATARVVVSTFAQGQGLTARDELPAAFAPGDRLGARAWSNGSVELYRDAVRIGTASTGDWPFTPSGGRIGFVLNADLPARIDGFGGGDIVQNTAPTATILTPADGSFFVEGDALALWGRARDSEQAPATLSCTWRLDLHHGSHVHPGAFQASGTSATYPIPAHEDGNGVWYEIEFQVADSAGLADTARASVHPEVDLLPRPVAVLPAQPGTTAPAEYRFTVANAGRMPTPTSRWRLASGGVLLAEGDVQIAALDSVALVVNVPPLLPAGDHTLRLVVDTLGTVVETAEGNNGLNRPITVVEGPGTVGSPGPDLPAAVSLSSACPTPAGASVSFTLGLPRAARVGFAVLDPQGRRVWRQPDRLYEAGRPVLRWEGARQGGGPAPAGLYLARVTVEGRTLVRRIAWVR
jgi:PKD repeat protein